MQPASHSDTLTARYMSAMRAIKKIMAIGSEILGRGRLGNLSWRDSNSSHEPQWGLIVESPSYS